MATWCTLQKNFSYLFLKNPLYKKFLYFLKQTFFLHFGKWKFLGGQFQEGTFQARKIKKIKKNSEKISYISGNGTF